MKKARSAYAGDSVGLAQPNYTYGRRTAQTDRSPDILVPAAAAAGGDAGLL